MSQDALKGSSAREAEAIASLALMAALANGRRDQSEIARLKEVFASFGLEGVASVYRRVVLGDATIEGEAAALASDEMRHLAYALAAAVCDADAWRDAKESAFLIHLKDALGLSGDEAAAIDRQSAAFRAPPDRSKSLPG